VRFDVGGFGEKRHLVELHSRMQKNRQRALVNFTPGPQG
jgi:hypothetical protein